jgi:hypothetical protein
VNGNVGRTHTAAEGARDAAAGAQNAAVEARDAAIGAQEVVTDVGQSLAELRSEIGQIDTSTKEGARRLEGLLRLIAGRLGLGAPEEPNGERLHFVPRDLDLLLPYGTDVYTPVVSNRDGRLVAEYEPIPGLTSSGHRPRATNPHTAKLATTFGVPLTSPTVTPEVTADLRSGEAKRRGPRRRYP